MIGDDDEVPVGVLRYGDPSKHTCAFDGRAACRECQRHRNLDPMDRVHFRSERTQERQRRRLKALRAAAHGSRLRKGEP